jgi:hypothetical protein
MTKSKGVGRTGRPKSTPLGPGIPGTARTAKPGTVEAIEDVLALMAVENAKPNPNLGRQRSYSDILGAHQKLLARADAESADCTRTDLGKARADIMTYVQTVSFLSDELRASAVAQDRDLADSVPSVQRPSSFVSGRKTYILSKHGKPPISRLK